MGSNNATVCKCMVSLKSFPYDSALFGLVSYNEPGK